LFILGLIRETRFALPKIIKKDNKYTEEGYTRIFKGNRDKKERALVIVIDSR
jgi:hypothetical protein